MRLGLLLALSLLPSPAWADDKAACVGSYEEGQKHRSEGRYGAARTELLSCARDVCPAVLRADCTQWLREVEAAQPTIVLRAEDARGRDLVDVKVTLDGKPLADRIDGRALQVDPGVHELRFEAQGMKPRDERLVIREGEKLRAVTVRFADDRQVSPPPPVPPPREAAPGTSPMVFVLAGVGALGLGTFGYFAVRGTSQKSDLDACRPNCRREDVDDAKQSFLIGDVALVGGLVALGAATILYVSGRARVGVARGQILFQGVF
jgi:hypothetical protein